jgi:hypothetical protein
VPFSEPFANLATGAMAALLGVGMTKAGPPRDTGPDVAVIGVGIGIGLGGDERIFSGFASNFARQPAEQKRYSLPLSTAL